MGLYHRNYADKIPFIHPFVEWSFRILRLPLRQLADRNDRQGRNDGGNELF